MLALKNFGITFQPCKNKDLQATEIGVNIGAWHWFSLIGKILPFITSTYTINTLKSVPINPREALIGLMLYDPTYPNFPRNPCD